MARRLTMRSHLGGCACKLSIPELEQILNSFPPTQTDSRLLAGFNTWDDAAVYEMSDDLAVVFTADFFPPIVDSPSDWGAIAAANALSDVYAMGGEPLLALNLVSWPREDPDLGLEVLGEVLTGASKVAGRAGVLVVGGHSIDDPEPKYGMAVLGRVTPDQLITNAAGRSGDSLILTKPIGTGVISTALKTGLADPDLVSRATSLMIELNAVASVIARQQGVRAGTDVSGFGLVGHLVELARASRLEANLWSNQVPVIEGARQLSRKGVSTTGTRRNHAHLKPQVDWGGLPLSEQYLLCDPQTSGGLLLAVPSAKTKAVLRALIQAEVPGSTVVGRLVEGSIGRIVVQ